ncbi:MAG: HD domain-containing protein [Armatimonadia bacterium]|nr:HD domain-containing protein [Armatimonadia bacterium]
MTAYRKHRYVSVSPASIYEGDRLACDLYVCQQPGKHVLFLSSETPFVTEFRQNLISRRIDSLYLRAEDLSVYAEHILSRLERAGELSTREMEERATAAYEGTRFLLDNVYRDPRLETVGWVERGAMANVEFAIEEPGSAVHMMRLTRHDAYTAGHSMNVAVFGMALAMAVGEHADWMKRVSKGLFLHDIGKTKVPQDVINCPGKLSDAQWAIMRKHPQYGEEVLRSMGRTDPIVLNVVTQHHERMDGSGYPKGLKGDEISYEARICTIVDVFDALTTERPYREMLSTYEGLSMMLQEMRDHVEPDLFAAFIRLFEENPSVLTPPARDALGQTL